VEACEKIASQLGLSLREVLQLETGMKKIYFWENKKVITSVFRQS